MRTAIQITAILAVAYLCACTTTTSTTQKPTIQTQPNQTELSDIRGRLKTGMEEIVSELQPLMANNQAKLKSAVRQTDIDELKKQLPQLKMILAYQMDNKGNPDWRITTPTALRLLPIAIRIYEEEINRREKLMANIKAEGLAQFEYGKELVRDEIIDSIRKLSDHELQANIHQKEQRAWGGNPPDSIEAMFDDRIEFKDAEQLYDTTVLFILREELERRKEKNQ